MADHQAASKREDLKHRLADGHATARQVSAATRSSPRRGERGSHPAHELDVVPRHRYPQRDIRSTRIRFQGNLVRFGELFGTPALAQASYPRLRFDSARIETEPPVSPT